MAYPCPRCGDRYTQSLPMVYGTGTHVRNWRSRSGYSGSTVSQSIVGSLATPPLKRSVLKPLLWLLVLWVFVGGPITFAAQRLVSGTSLSVPAPIVNGPLYHPSHRGRLPRTTGISREQSEQLTLIAATVGTAISALLIWRAAAALKFNRLNFPRLLQSWQSAFLCRGCGMIFHLQQPHELANEGW